jgi:hypothetical protein
LDPRNYQIPPKNQNNPTLMANEDNFRQREWIPATDKTRKR